MAKYLYVSCCLSKNPKVYVDQYHLKTLDEKDNVAYGNDNLGNKKDHRSRL